MPGTLSDEGHRALMVARLCRLERSAGVTVERGGREDIPTIVTITHAAVHTLSFRFRWVQDHFVGYLINAAGADEQPGVVSLWDVDDAAQFVQAYRLLIRLRAGRHG